MACTTILVGKNASYDGSTLVARNEDSGSGQYCSKKFIVVQPEDQPKNYKSVISHVEIPLPTKPMRYTCMPNAIDNEGIWGACGVNEANVAMSATETITSNENVQAADPLVRYVPAIAKKGEDDYVAARSGGIGEEDMVTLILPYIRSAREGVSRMATLLKKYGTYEMNGVAFQDVNEIWWLETIGGHHWMAKRVPDDAYVVMPNQLGIDQFDFDDALGEQKHHMCSDDLKQFIDRYHLDLSLDGTFNPRDAFGSHSDADHVYNTPRAWVIQRYLNPTSNVWDGAIVDYGPDSDDIPWSRVPEKKITLTDIKYILSNHFQGTPYDPYASYGDAGLRGKYRPIGINRNNFLGLTQIRPYLPEAIRSIEWFAFGSNVFNAMIPCYVNINSTPAYFANTTAQVTTENFYWANRMVAALADAHYKMCASHIERYQLDLQAKCMALLHRYDQKMAQLNYHEAAEICEIANLSIAEQTKVETDKLLDKVLCSASNGMKNSFSRSDA